MAQAVDNNAHIVSDSNISNQADSEASEFDVAIVGMAGRFPGADSVSEFWRLLVGNQVSLTHFQRDDLIAAGVPAVHVDDPEYVRAAPVLQNVARFDEALFGYSPREAERIDPQQRHLLELAWAALDDAGLDPSRETGRVGVFAGSALNSYLLNSRLADNFFDDYLPNLLGSDKDFLATRIAYKLGLRGPALTVQTACSTSLVALHLASQSLLSGESDVALVGAMAIRTPQAVGHQFEVGSVFSPDGLCRPFDADAAGTVFGSGGACLVLRRLSDAIEQRHTVRAIVKGSAINNDGSAKSDFTAPSIEMQSDAIADALAAADVSARSIDYVEAHGTGTYLGDPIEIAALSRAFALDDVEVRSCGIGSVKSNIGHLDAAAGLASIVKVTLALENEQLPATVNFKAPNPQIGIEKTPFQVVSKNRGWPRAGRPRRAGVSSLGMGGTNAHVVLEEAPGVAKRSDRDDRAVVLPLSARSKTALDRMAGNLSNRLADSGLDLDDVAFTLQQGRQQLSQRGAIVAANCADARDHLGKWAASDRVRQSGPLMHREVALLFPGQGSQYAQMGCDLIAKEPVFARAFERSRDIVLAASGLDLSDVVHNTDGASLNETNVTQPALFAIEHAYAALLASWGVEAKLVLGHSIGEFAAAVVAGVMDHDAALRLVVKRGQLMFDAPRGCMLAVPLPEVEVVALLPEELDICVVNSPEACVVGGPEEAIEVFADRLGRDDIRCTVLRTSHAFHSRSMTAAAEAFKTCFEGVELRPARIPMLSNITGQLMSASEATDPARWARQIREPVRFDQCLSTLFLDKPSVLMEVGPGVSLSQFTNAHDSRPATHVALSAGRHPRNDNGDHACALAGLAGCWVNGVTVDWSESHRHDRASLVPLPAYPFEGGEHWLEPKPNSGGATAVEIAAPAPAEMTLWRETSQLVTFRSSGPLAPDDEPNVRLMLAPIGLASWASDVALAQLESYGVPAVTIADVEALSASVAAVHDARSSVVTVMWPITATLSFCSEDLLRAGLALCQAIASWPSKSVKLHLLSVDASSVLDTHSVSPAVAALYASCRVAAREIENLSVVWLDFESSTEQWTRDYHDGLQTLDPGKRVQSVAKRENRWWVPAFQRMAAVADWRADPSPGHESGDDADNEMWHLVIGASGGIGTVLVEHFSTHGVSVVAASRQSETKGATVRLDPGSEHFAQEFAAIVAGRGSPPAYVHMVAGRVADGSLLAKTPQVLDEVLAPKVSATDRVLQACRDHQVGALVLYASTGAVEGAAGQFDYAAANAHQLALSSLLHDETRVLAIGWPGWIGTGMLSRIADAQRLQAVNRLGIEPAVALETLDALLASKMCGPVIVSAIPPDQLAEVAPETDAAHAQSDAAEASVSEVLSADALIRAAWSDSLGIEELADNADFYALGGNSLALTQIVSRLRKKDGVMLDVGEALSSPKLSVWIELAAVDEKTDVSSDVSPVGSVEQPLTDQAVAHYGVRRFRSRRQGSLSSRWNLASLMTLARPVPVEALEAATRQLMLRHDALRASLDADDNLVFDPGPRLVPVEFIDLSESQGPGWPEALASALEDAHTRFDLAAGPMFRVLLIEGGQAQGQRIFLVAHHFFVDGLSWSILLSDLQSALKAELGLGGGIGDHVTLGYREWADALQQRADSAQFRAKSSEWGALPAREQCCVVPRDGDGKNRNNTARAVDVILGQQESEALQQLGAEGVALEDLSLVALARAVAGESKQPVIIDVLGLGRELSDEIDVSRSVGYFNSYAPVLFENSFALPLPQQLAAVFQARQKGAEHDLLRYVTADPAVHAAMNELPEAQVLFNYIGNLKSSNSSLLDNVLWRTADEPTGSLHDPHGLRDHELAVRAEFVNGRLQLTLVYSSVLHDEVTVRSLLDRFSNELCGLALRD